jgi:Tfp pilus assembly protein PilF
MKIADAWRAWRSEGKPGTGHTTSVASRSIKAPVCSPVSVPTVSDAEHVLAAAERLLASGDARAALVEFRRLIDSVVVPARAHVGEARAYHALNQVEDAADSLEVALAIDPDAVDALRLLARIRREEGGYALALALNERACAIVPNEAAIHAECASLLARLGRAGDAIARYQHAVGLAPDEPMPRINLGLLYLQHEGEPEMAESCFRAVLSRFPDHLEAHANLGLALHDQGRHAEAFEIYRAGLTAHPENVELRWNRGLANLSLRNFDAGWPDYQLRFARRGGRNLERFSFPNWNGESLPHARLLVLAEQGLGDEIMFASCLSDLITQVRDVVLECAPRLSELFARSFPQIAVHGRDRHAPLDWLAAYPDIAAMVPIGSLPAYLRRDESAFPPVSGYLRADAERIAAYRRRLAGSRKRLMVGLSWRGGSHATRGAVRSIELGILRVLTEVSDVQFVALQHDLMDAERTQAEMMGLHVLDGVASDIDDLAALVSALDLVVAVDNMVLHLAGALGVNSLGLLGVSPEWRWSYTGNSVPWYPSIRVLRAKAYGGWDAMLAAVAKMLAATHRDALPPANPLIAR